jgi:glutamate 5-kinase
MDVVSIVDASGHEFARGIANCASGDAERFAGKKNSLEGKQGTAASRILVTRDNIVLLQQS